MPRDFSDRRGLLLTHYDVEASESAPLFSRESGVAEVVIPPRSGLIGETAFPGMVTESGDLVILAVNRRGEKPGRRR